MAQFWTLTRKSVSAWMDDYAPSMGAALAYYTLFSLAPVLVIAIAIAGLVFGIEAARGGIVDQLRGLIGDEGALAVQGLLKSASRPSTSWIASIASTVTLIIGAMGVFNELQSDLDRIWRAPAAKKRTGLWAMLRQRLLTFGMVLAGGFLLLVSLVISAGVAALGHWWGPYFGAWEMVLQAVNLVVSYGLAMAMFAAIYKILPRVRVTYRDVWIGAAVTAALFTVGKFLIGVYLGKSGVASGYGAAGSIVVLLVWVYYSAQIFLLGAEFTWVYAHGPGSRVSTREPGAPASVPTRSTEAAREPAVMPSPSPAAAFSPMRGDTPPLSLPGQIIVVGSVAGAVLSTLLGAFFNRRAT